VHLLTYIFSYRIAFGWYVLGTFAGQLVYSLLVRLFHRPIPTWGTLSTVDDDGVVTREVTFIQDEKTKLWHADGEVELSPRERVLLDRMNKLK